MMPITCAQLPSGGCGIRFTVIRRRSGIRPAAAGSGDTTDADFTRLAAHVPVLAVRPAASAAAVVNNSVSRLPRAQSK